MSAGRSEVLQPMVLVLKPGLLPIYLLRALTESFKGLFPFLFWGEALVLYGSCKIESVKTTRALLTPQLLKSDPCLRPHTNHSNKKCLS